MDKKVDERPERIYFVASSKSRLAGKVQIPVQELLKEPLYLTEKKYQLPLRNGTGLSSKGHRTPSLSRNGKHRCYNVFSAEKQRGVLFFLNT